MVLAANNKELYNLSHIETQRLLIRPIRLEDANEINIAINNSLISLQKWMPWANDPSIEATLNFVQEGVFAIDSKNINNFPMVVTYKENNKLIGVSGYNERSIFADGVYEVGYWCDIDYQGMGLVTEYVNALSLFALEALKAKVVVIRSQVDNIKSINVAKRLNFKEMSIVDSATTEGAKDYYFTISSIDKLPRIECSWQNNANNNSISGMILWAKNTLGVDCEESWIHGKAIAKTPWSSVYNLYAKTDSCFLKWCPKDLFIESKIINTIHKLMIDAPVPKVLGDNKSLDCFLTESCGQQSLRSIFQEKLDFDLWCRGLDNYTKIMRAQEYYIEEFLGIGVPDWRVEKLPELYGNILEEHDLLKQEGMNNDELNTLHNLHGKIKKITQDLESSKISQTFINSDFNENNMILDTEKNTVKIIDLGEAIISHPFFTIAAHLSNSQRRYAMEADGHDLEKIKIKWLANWEDVASMDEINADGFVA